MEGEERNKKIIEQVKYVTLTQLIIYIAIRICSIRLYCFFFNLFIYLFIYVISFYIIA